MIQVSDTTAGQAPYVVFPTFVSQDGSLVTFIVRQGLSDPLSDVRLYIGSADATSFPRAITPPGLNVCPYFNIPPSYGSKIGFLARDTLPCETTAPFGDVYIVGTDGTAPTRLTFDAPNDQFSSVWYEDVVASGDGRTVAFTQQQPSPTNPNPIKVEHLFLIDSDGTNRREIVLPAEAFSGVVEWFQPLSFSADGMELAFVYRDFINSREGVMRIAAIRTDGTGFRKLVDPLEPADPWALSGDWTTLTFATAEGLFVQRLGAPPGPPLASGAGAYPTISYDGGRICYSGLVAFQTADVFCVKSDGSDLANLSNVPSGVQANFPALSRDGSVVAFLSAGDLVAGRNSDNSVEVFSARLRPVGPVSPSATSVNPTFGPSTGGTSVTITGTGFVLGASVAFGDAPATSVVFVDANTLQATTPGAPSPGPVDVVVTNPDGQSGVLVGAFTYAVVVLPTISITDAVVTEGNAGHTNMMFTVTLSAPTTLQVAVNYATRDGSASTTLLLGYVDYESASGVLTFVPGTTEKIVTIAVAGDTLKEDDETFFVDLAHVVNGVALKTTGQGLIRNDDAIGLVLLAHGWCGAPNSFGSLANLLTDELGAVVV